MMDPAITAQVAGFSLQQGVALAFSFATTCALCWALVKLFSSAKEEREKAQAARDQDRITTWTYLDGQRATLEGIKGAITANATATDANTRAMERLTDGVLRRRPGDAA